MTIEDRRVLAESFTPVEAAVDSEPPIVRQHRVQILDLLIERLLQTGDVRGKLTDGIGHQLLAVGPGIVTVPTIRRPDVERHDIERHRS